MQIKNSRQPTDPILTLQLKRIKKTVINWIPNWLFLFDAVNIISVLQTMQRFRLYFYLLSDLYNFSLNSAFANRFLSFFYPPKNLNRFTLPRFVRVPPANRYVPSHVRPAKLPICCSPNRMVPGSRSPSYWWNFSTMPSYFSYTMPSAMRSCCR